MFAFQYDADGYLIGMIDCDPHPLRPRGWIVPGMATLAIPPVVPDGMRARWTGKAWRLVAADQHPKTPETRYGMVSAWLAQLLAPRGFW